MNGFLLIQMLTIGLGSLAAMASLLLFFRLHWPAPARWFLKLYASALSPVFVVIGLLTIITGLVTKSVVISAIGLYDFLVFSLHILRITRSPDFSGSFELDFSLKRNTPTNTEQNKYLLTRRSALWLPAVPNPRLQQNISFATLPPNGRELFCDVWQPGENIPNSGLAFIYLHGSAWYLLDKDLGTRPLFRQLAAQGHVIMDVAYRLAPETDLMGMISDAKRAVAWMKDNADTYKIDPNRVVIGGGSAGGHLALMAAYTAYDPGFIQEDLEGKDTSVSAVISLYGPADLEAMYYHTNQHLTTRSAPGRPKKPVPTKMPGWIIKRMGENYKRLGFDKGFENAGAFAPLLGGHPDECPGTYALFSPITHVSSHCPPTLLVHGGHDLMAPVQSTRYLHNRLLDKRVPTVMHILPQTDHAFDLQLPGISPAAHSAFYDVEHFMASRVMETTGNK